MKSVNRGRRISMSRVLPKHGFDGPDIPPPCVSIKGKDGTTEPTCTAVAGSMRVTFSVEPMICEPSSEGSRWVEVGVGQSGITRDASGSGRAASDLHVRLDGSILDILDEDLG